MKYTNSLVSGILSSPNLQQTNYLASHLLSDIDNLIVYGHGEGFFPLKRTVLSPLKISPSVIIDRKYTESFNRDCVLYIDLEGFKALVNVNKNSPIVITLGSKILAEEVTDNFRSLGFQHIFWAPDLYEYSLHHSTESIDSIRDLCIAHSDQIDSAFNLFSDSVSQSVFQVVLSRYLLGLPHPVPSLPFSEQYLGNDLPLPPNPVSYVCCGAYDGDSIEKITEKFSSIEQIFALEPDPQNYANLSAYVKKHSLSYPNRRITSLPLGISSHTHLASFSSSSGLSTTLDPDGDNFLPLVSLDDLLTSTPVSLLTMDVEGAEFDALHGAHNIITSSRPTLAISVYHYPSHLWSILNHLASLNLSYNFFLRNYSGHTYESVLYAVPVND
ncbi:methyltransferase, FkbM family domain protein [Synechococcus sp. WH 8103]|nr:methyltransferase, FkbM family domain protein [Synechococcus sp. WH 8103]